MRGRALRRRWLAPTPHLGRGLQRLEAQIERAQEEIVSLGDGLGALGELAKQAIAPLGERVVEPYELEKQQPFLFEVAIEHADHETTKRPLEAQHHGPEKTAVRAHLGEWIEE